MVTKSTAAVIKKDGKFLICKRKLDGFLGGKWEFPGGKIEDYERPRECLERELKEEFEIKTKAGEFICESLVISLEKPLRMRAYWVEYLGGEFKLHEHEEIKWVTKEDFKNYDFIEADQKIIESIK